MGKETYALTGQQLYELKWFCSNVMGVRADFYKTVENCEKFEMRLSRLERTCEIIEKFLGEKIETAPSGVFE